MFNNQQLFLISRPEAMNLLIDLAYKNRKAHRDSDSTGSSIQSNTTSPRRLRRGNNKNCSTNTSNISQSETDKTDSKSKYSIHSCLDIKHRSFRHIDVPFVSLSSFHHLMNAHLSFRLQLSTKIYCNESAVITVLGLRDVDYVPMFVRCSTQS